MFQPSPLAAGAGAVGAHWGPTAAPATAHYMCSGGGSPTLFAGPLEGLPFSTVPQVLLLPAHDAAMLGDAAAMPDMPMMLARPQLAAPSRMSHHQQQQVAPPASLFFASVTPVATPAQLASLFSHFGRVLDINVFKPFSGCKTSKGCGVVVFATRKEAAAAMDALHGKFVWPGARSAMVIEWMDPHKQHKKRRAQPLTHLAGTRQSPGAMLTPRAVTALAGGHLARTNSNSSASVTIEADWLELLA